MGLAGLLIGIPGMVGYSMANVYGTENIILSKKMINRQREMKVQADKEARALNSKLGNYVAHVNAELGSTGPSGGSGKALSKRDVDG